jgi:hypothetical protein
MSEGDDALFLSIRTGDLINPDANLFNILQELGTDWVLQLIWGVESLDATGPEAQEFIAWVEQSSDHRLLISGKEFLELAPKLGQTIEGVFVGYKSNDDTTEFLEGGWGAIHFADSSAELVIEIVDGTYFDLYMRSQTVSDRLTKRFEATHVADAGKFLL